MFVLFYGRMKLFRTAPRLAPNVDHEPNIFTIGSRRLIDLNAVELCTLVVVPGISAEACCRYGHKGMAGTEKSDV